MSSRRVQVGAVVSGKYRLTELLGGGGMGEVYRAEHMLAGRTVALKLLHADFVENQDLTRRFFQEAQAANRIRHPNIVDVIDAGFSDEGPYVVMECLEGISLARAVAGRRKLDAATSIAVMLPLLDALEAAHRQGIVHRDLKPENVFLARVGQDVHVKILDFGIAKVLDTDSTSRPRTHTGVVFGTPDYLSPEQARGDGVIDGRSDIFSAGTLLFELLTGNRPFQANNAVAIAYRIVHEEPPRLSELGIVVDPRLQAALQTALAKSPDDRFTTAASFADMLASVGLDGVTRRQALRELVENALREQNDRADVPRASSDTVRSEPRLIAAEASPDETPLKGDSNPPSKVTMQSYSYDLVAAKNETVKPAADALSALREETRVDWRPRTNTTPLPPSFRPSSFTPTPPSQSGISSIPASRRSLLATPATPSSIPRSSWPASSGSRIGTATRPPISYPSDMPEPELRSRCHVRGTMPRAASRWIERTHGPMARNDVLQLLPPEHAESFRTDAFNSLVWYDLEPLELFMEAATSLLMVGEASGWRDLGREHFDRDLRALLKGSARLTDPNDIVKRASIGWGKIFDFGTVRILKSHPKRLALRIEGFRAAALPLRLAMLGTFEGLFRSSGLQDATGRIISGELSFARDFELDFSWKA